MYIAENPLNFCKFGEYSSLIRTIIHIFENGFVLSFIYQETEHISISPVCRYMDYSEGTQREIYNSYRGNHFLTVRTILRKIILGG